MNEMENKPAEVEDASPQWSREEQRILHHEAFVKEVIRVRDEADPEKKQTSTLLRIIESTAFAALITVVFGGLISQLIILKFQNNRAREEQARNESKQLLAHLEETVTLTYNLVGRTTHASEALITITSTKFDPENVPEEDRAKLQNQREEVKNKYNSVIEEWTAQEGKMGFLMRYNHPKQPKILSEWAALQQTLNEFNTCALLCYEQFQSSRQPDLLKEKCDKCDEKKSRIKISLEKFALALGEARQALWH